MANQLEIRERHRNLLGVLLNLKKLNSEIEVKGLQERIQDALIPMDQEDVAYVEKIIGVKAL